MDNTTLYHQYAEVAAYATYSALSQAEINNGLDTSVAQIEATGSTLFPLTQESFNWYAFGNADSNSVGLQDLNFGATSAWQIVDASIQNAPGNIGHHGLIISNYEVDGLLLVNNTNLSIVTSQPMIAAGSSLNLNTSEHAYQFITQSDNLPTISFETTSQSSVDALIQSEQSDAGYTLTIDLSGHEQVLFIHNNESLLIDGDELSIVATQNLDQAHIVSTANQWDITAHSPTPATSDDALILFAQDLFDLNASANFYSSIVSNNSLQAFSFGITDLPQNLGSLSQNVQINIGYGLIDSNNHAPNGSLLLNHENDTTVLFSHDLFITDGSQNIGSLVLNGQSDIGHGSIISSNANQPQSFGATLQSGQSDTLNNGSVVGSHLSALSFSDTSHPLAAEDQAPAFIPV
jgi:hypothetical protein